MQPQEAGEQENKQQTLLKLRIEPCREEYVKRKVDSDFERCVDSYHDVAGSALPFCSTDLTDEVYLESNSEREGEKCITKGRYKYSYCSVCDKYVRYIGEHRRMHLNQRSQICPYCEKSFVHRSNLYNHINIHTRQRTYKCTLCSSEFNSPQGLNQHRQGHLDTKYKCLECGYLFKRKSYLRTHHQKVHQPKIRLTCLICDKTFLIATKLNKHMEIHGNEEMFTCEICQRAYSARRNVLRHIRTAHPEAANSSID